MEINAKKLLLKKENIDLWGLKSGTSGPAGMISSKHKGTDISGKYNLSLKVMEDLLKGNLNALLFTNHIYVEYKGAKITFDGKNINSDKELSDEQIIAPVVLDIINHAEDKELDELFNSIKKEKELVNKINLIKFCDYIYYSIEVDSFNYDGEVNIEQSIKQAARKGDYSTLNCLKGLTLPPLSLITNTVINEEKKTEDLWIRAKKGELLIPYDFKEKEFLQPLTRLNTFVPTKVFYRIMKKFDYRLRRVLSRMDSGLEGLDAICNDYVNCILVGRPGTGKTASAYALAAALGLPICTISNSKNTEEGKFEGEAKVVNGAVDMIDSEFYRIYTNGGIIVLEEFNLADPAVIMGALGQAIEFPFILKKDGYKTVRRHPLCIIISTMNTGTMGTKKVNEAFSSRNKQSFILDDPTEEDFVKILESYDEDFKKDDCRKVYRAYNKILNFLKTDDGASDYSPEDVIPCITLRSCLGTLENMQEGDTLKEALQSSILGKIAESSLELAELVNSEVVDHLPD